MTLNDSKNSTITFDETEILPSVSKKKRGAPKGVLRGPRPTYFVGAAIDDNGELILKSILSSSSDDDEVDLDEISKSWEEEFGLKPLKILGPFYEKKTSSSNVSHKKKDNVDFNLDDLTFSGERKYGEFNGWEVIVQLLKNPKDYGWLIFKEEIGGDDSRKKQKPASKAVKLDEINNLRENP